MNHQNLWAPWRMAYLQQMEAQESTDLSEDTPTPPQPSTACFLCEAAKVDTPSNEAREQLVLLRDRRGLIQLNRYPYTNGHLLVAPIDHLPDLTDLSPDERAGLIELTALAQRVIKAAINPQGMNIGINLGRCAGAGLPGHLHVHIVPRWSGDTNFIQTVGQVRVIPQALEDSYNRLSQAMEAVIERSDEGMA